MRRWGDGRVAVAAMALVAGLWSSKAQADAKAHEFYYQENQQRFVLQPQDARMVGMAGSTALTTSGAISTVTNPAGLGLMKYGDASLSYGHNQISGHTYPGGSSVKDSQNSGQVYGAVPLGPVKDALPDYGNLGFGWYGRGGDWSGDPDNVDTGTYQVSGAYAKSIGDKMALGYSLSYQNDSVDGDSVEYDSTNSFLQTIGLQVRDSENLTFGGMVNVGFGSHNVKYKLTPQDNQSVDQVSIGVGGGTEYVMGSTTLAGGIDYTYYRNNGNNNILGTSVWGGDSFANSMNVRLGIEEQVLDWLALRVGYLYAANFKWDYNREYLNDLSGSAKYNSVTMGAGINYALEEGSTVQAIRADYGAQYKDIGNGDWLHMVTLTTPFDICM
jgi:hypothetical protein